ncbi:hypothetical protein CAAN1_32S00353 [[Candida] anglica]|uniref:Uncharacterized protein n=1 Tax=[Candida] anglica TaxID=148631 RepID=A0ABP0EAH2_9ASCO
MGPSSATRRLLPARALLIRREWPPRLVAHGVPAERLSTPCRVAQHTTSPGCKTLRWPLLGESHCVVPSSSSRRLPLLSWSSPRQRSKASTASGPRSASGAACNPRRVSLLTSSRAREPLRLVTEGDTGWQASNGSALV